MSILPSLSKSKIATPPAIGCTKYFRGDKSLLVTYENFDCAAMLVKYGRLFWPCTAKIATRTKPPKKRRISRLNKRHLGFDQNQNPPLHRENRQTPGPNQSRQLHSHRRHQQRLQ